MSLQYASKELQNDEEVVLEAVSQNSSSIRYASKNLQNENSVISKASLEGNILCFVSSVGMCDFIGCKKESLMACPTCKKLKHLNNV